ncbi:aldose 1-epimerase family protein [Novosphingobium sp. Leaf2]|uniref:aldose 1-epimerase family protein n=1 Tax=Novosphingobium sp. Leaf2 TaxID=1735670 RepID=UPI000700AA47|nr:aldose 1-epimerase family protein [Novosphingobium sp. Leaf2]KQM20270.1 aldose epimerase [Novosphingobium sp. Leaf2]
MTDAQLVTIASDELTAQINLLGAEVWSLTDARGQQYMTDADPAFWTGHAPVLFPIVGMLNEGRYRLGDAEYALPKHGFARHSHFEVVEAGADHVLFRLKDSEATRAVYPFAFVLDIKFRLDGFALHVAAKISNPGAQPLPFSFGFHPAFAWPLPGGTAKADHVVSFQDAEPQPIRRIDAKTGLLLPETFPTPVDGHLLHPDAALFEADALIWDTLSSREVTFGAPGGAQVTVAFPDAPMLGIWQKPGAAYLCIEPWQGIADPVGFADDFHDKPGVLTLPPGAAHDFRMDVTVLAAD